MVFRVLQLTDLHLLADPKARFKGIPTQEALRDVLDFVRAQRLEFDSVVLTGDLAHHGEAGAYRFLAEALGSNGSACRFLCGNHDSRKELQAALGAGGTGNGRVTFTFDARDWRFVGLDTLVVDSGAGRLGADQLVWLEETLASAGGRPVAIFMHHPPMSVGSTWLDRIGLEDADAFAELVAMFENVEVICCGHVHQEFEGDLCGAAVLAAPSTCLQFEPATDEPVFALEPPGFRVLEFDDGGFRSEVIRLPETKYHPAV